MMKQKELQMQLEAQKRVFESELNGNQKQDIEKQLLEQQQAQERIYSAEQRALVNRDR